MMAAGGEIPLPENLLQRVQYFLTSKEAARTSVLSKSWGSAWLTRPNLDFDFGPFSEFAGKTLKRYEDSNLKIESFRLRVENRGSFDHTRISKLIVTALKLGATRLDAVSHGFYYRRHAFFLLNEVLASENLVELTLNGCEIDRDVVWRCPRLRSLIVENLQMNHRETVRRIIRSFPLIEKLSLCNVGYSDGGNGGIIADGDLIILPRLRSLVLEDVKSDNLFLCGISSNYFPSLKDLTLKMHFTSREENPTLISSPSLERLHLKAGGYYGQRLLFDVPSIRKFTFSGDSIPSLSFRSTSSAWESHVFIRRGKCLTTSWFRKLNKLLTKLRRSRIHMFLRVSSRLSFDYKFGDMQGLSTHVIENLTIDLKYLPSLSWYALLDCLFLMCRPKLITPRNNFDFIGQTLLQGLGINISTPTQFMYGLKDLKEAKAQVFDADVSGWRDVPLDAFLDKSTTPAKDNRGVRFQLKWKS